MCVHVKKLKSSIGGTTLHLSKSWGGPAVGPILTVTINNDEEIIRAQFTQDQAKELSEAISRTFISKP